MNTLQGKTTLITGASAGIGYASALRFAAAGANLVLAARSVDTLEALREELLGKYSNIAVHVLPLDVSNREQVQSAITSLPENFKDIDILVNNAGLALGNDPIQNGDIDDWETMIDVNVKGVLYLVRAILPSMIARRSGTIINLGSVAGRSAYPTGNVYCATKAAVRAISDAIRVDTVGTGVRCTDIEPARVRTNFEFVRGGDKELATKKYEMFTVLEAEDIADAILYAASVPRHVVIQELLISSIDQATATIIKKSN